MYKKVLIPLVILCLLLNNALIQAAPSQKHIQTTINNILRQNTSAHIGIIVQSLKTGKILYQKNANQLFVPASSLKIFTAVAALSFLGPNYQFQTKILTENNTVTHGTLNSNIYFRFEGDPTLTQEHIDELIAKLSGQGIHYIN